MSITDTFEYDQRELRIEQTMGPFTDIVKEWLNDLGKHGWQLVSKLAWCDNGNDTETYSAWFMRVKESG